MYICPNRSANPRISKRSLIIEKKYAAFMCTLCYNTVYTTHRIPIGFDLKIHIFVFHRNANTTRNPKKNTHSQAKHDDHARSVWMKNTPKPTHRHTPTQTHRFAQIIRPVRPSFDAYVFRGDCVVPSSKSEWWWSFRSALKPHREGERREEECARTEERARFLA